MDSVSSPHSEVVETMEHVSKDVLLLQILAFHLLQLIFFFFFFFFFNFLVQNKLWEINFFHIFSLKVNLI